MAVQSRVNYVGGLRIDLPDLLATDSYVVNDVRNLLMSIVGSNSYTVQGLEVTGWLGLTVSVKIDGAIVFCPSNSTAPFYKGLDGDTDLTLTLQSNTTDIYLELGLETTTSGSVTKGFWDSLAVTSDSPAGSEFTEAIDAQVIVIPKLVQKFDGFSPNAIKIAKISTSETTITKVIDARELFFRLATGGATPNKAAEFAWDETATQEPPDSTSSSSDLLSTNANSIYYSYTTNATVLNDKGIKSFKEWLDALMTIIKQMKGTPTWYQGVGNSVGFPANLSMLSLFRDSPAGHSIVADPSVTVYWGATDGSTNNSLNSQCTGSTRFRWQSNYGYPVVWELGGTYSTGRQYSSSNFISPSVSTGQSLYLQLQRDVLLTTDIVTWRPTAAPSGSSFVANRTIQSAFTGRFTGIAVGDYVKKESEGILYYYKVISLYTSPSTVVSTEGVIADANVTAIQVDRDIDGTTNNIEERYIYFRSRYSNADLKVYDPTVTPANDVDLYWIGRRTGDSFLLRGYGNLSKGEEVEVLEDGAQDQEKNDFGAEPILVLSPDVAFDSSGILAHNPNGTPSSGTTYLTLYKRKSNNRVNSNNTLNNGVFSYILQSSVTFTLGQGQELWVKLSDDYSASAYTLTSGNVTNSAVTNVYELRNPGNAPLRNYDNRNVFMLCKQITMQNSPYTSKSYLVFFDGSVVGEKGRATPQRLQVEEVWIHDTDVDVTSTTSSANLFASANSVKIGKSASVTRIEGAQSVKRASVSGTYTALSTDYILSVDTTSAAATINLPAISTVGDGQVLIIKDRTNNSYANTITVVRNGGNTIDGAAANFVIQSNGAAYTFVSNSATNDWEII